MASDFPRGWRAETDYTNVSPIFSIAGVPGITHILTDFLCVVSFATAAVAADGSRWWVAITSTDGVYTDHKIGFGWVDPTSVPGSVIEMTGSGEWHAGPGAGLSLSVTDGYITANINAALAVKGRDI